MKKKQYLTLLLTALGTTLGTNAQSAVDAMQLTRPDFKGTARFMGMGGAFTALGGDLSAISQNPAGIGIYRHSEIGATLDIDIQKTTGEFGSVKATNKQTKAYCNNFGYVGSVRLDGPLNNFNWGVNYNRAVSFDRIVGGYAPSTGTSLTNYIADFSTGIPAGEMDFGDDYNPYQDSDIDWLSILGYSSYMINPYGPNGDQYSGLYQNGTTADAEILVRERGYIDNYEFTFGGNFSNIVYWGVGVGINDLNYTRQVNYSESMANAAVFDGNGVRTGDAGFYLDNYKHITGTGWNLSFGLILKPIQEFRIGASIQSPTWYSLDHGYYAETDFSYSAPDADPLQGEDYTDDAFFNWRLRSPWKFSVGVAAVLGQNAILSLDYERLAYDDMTVKSPLYDGWGYIDGYQDNQYVNDDISEYTQSANNIRVGLEYRITPKFSARLGYNTILTNIRDAYKDGRGEILTSGTDPSFTLDKTTSYISGGLGYKFGGFYIDATCVFKKSKSTLHPYTSYASTNAPYFDVTDSNKSIVLTMGYKF